MMPLRDASISTRLYPSALAARKQKKLRGPRDLGNTPSRIIIIRPESAAGSPTRLGVNRSHRNVSLVFTSFFPLIYERNGGQRFKRELYPEKL